MLMRYDMGNILGERIEQKSSILRVEVNWCLTEIEKSSYYAYICNVFSVRLKKNSNSMILSTSTKTFTSIGLNETKWGEDNGDEHFTFHTHKKRNPRSIKATNQ